MKNRTLYSALFALSVLSGQALADSPISGTYRVTYDRMCVSSPARTTPTPAYFTLGVTADPRFGYILTPAGTTADQVYVSRDTAHVSYIMTVNPITNQITISNGTYQSLPLAVSNSTNPPSVASFGAFTGSGTFSYTGMDPNIDVNLQTLISYPDGVSKIYGSNISYRFQTTDKGESFTSIANRGYIELRYFTASKVYTDRHCAGTVSGRRISASY